jgi:hypothetical protein
MIGVVGGDEDPLPPDGQNPHPIPVIIDDFAAWHGHFEGPHQAQAQDFGDINVQFDAVPQAAPAAPVMMEEPVVHTPPQSPTLMNDPVTPSSQIHQSPAIPILDDQLGHQGNLEVAMTVPGFVASSSENVEDATESLPQDRLLAVNPSMSSVIVPSATHDFIQGNSSLSVRNVESQEEEEHPIIVRKRKVKPPVDVSKVRRSGRIAMLNAGYKNGKPVEVSEDETGVNLGLVFEAQVIDESAPPPPHLPLTTLQALGTGPCQMHPSDVSEDNLNYDSSNDSIE